MTEKIVKLQTVGAGYEMVMNGNPNDEDFQQFLHHRLLAVAEFGLGVVKGMVVHHKNKVPWDNRPVNIEVMSELGHNKMHLEGENAPWSKLTEEEVREIRQEYAGGGVTQMELAHEVGVRQPLISRAVRGDNWTHVGGPIKGEDYD